jgi:hypothetical protein
MLYIKANKRQEANMDIEAIKILIDESIPEDLSRYTPEDVDKKLLDSIQFVLEEIRFQIDRAYYQQQKQFLMS